MGLGSYSYRDVQAKLKAMYFHSWEYNSMQSTVEIKRLGDRTVENFGALALGDFFIFPLKPTHLLQKRTDSLAWNYDKRKEVEIFRDERVIVQDVTITHQDQIETA